MNEAQAKQLQFPFKSDEIEWRVLRLSKDKTKGQVAAYVDSRAIQNRLDKVIGRENWQNRFVSSPGKDNASTTHVCEISIYYPDRKEWITKSDGAGCTDIEPIKGGLSGAFKRAASMWGIGRYLYSLKNIWVYVDDKFIAEGEKEKLDEAYNLFIKKLLNTGNEKKEEPKATPKETKTEKPKTPAENKQAIPNGRFSGNDKPKSELFRVVDLKFTQGTSSSRTFVSFKSEKGKTVSGYIKGESELSIGQDVKELKVTQKHSDVVGDYNIIDGYQVAA